MRGPSSFGLHRPAAILAALAVMLAPACGHVRQIPPLERAEVPLAERFVPASPSPSLQTPLDRERPSPAPSSAPSPAPHVRNPAPFQGLGTWVDIYDDASWADPTRAVEEMKAAGVRTLYLQTSNFSRPFDIFMPDATREFITAAHARDMLVVAWYLPGLATMGRDLRRSKAAMAFRTQDGQAFDAFGLDVESQILDPPGVRTEALLSLSAELRVMAGDLPLAAITPSPVALANPPNGWPDFPWAGLNQHYDAFVPMDYFTSRAHGRREVRLYIEESARILREETGDAGVPIASIGGIAQVISGPEAKGFVDAVISEGLIGGSLYDFRTTHPSAWRALRAIA